MGHSSSTASMYDYMRSPKFFAGLYFQTGATRGLRYLFLIGQKNEHFQIMLKTCMKMIIASNSPLITICGMWSQFLDSGVVIFLHLKMATFGEFGCKKMGLRTPEYKNGDHFFVTFCQHYPNMLSSNLICNFSRICFKRCFNKNLKTASRILILIQDLGLG